MSTACRSTNKMVADPDNKAGSDDSASSWEHVGRSRVHARTLARGSKPRTSPLGTAAPSSERNSGAEGSTSVLMSSEPAGQASMTMTGPSLDDVVSTEGKIYVSSDRAALLNNALADTKETPRSDHPMEGVGASGECVQ